MNFLIPLFSSMSDTKQSNYMQNVEQQNFSSTTRKQKIRRHNRPNRISLLSSSIRCRSVLIVLGIICFIFPTFHQTTSFNLKTTICRHSMLESNCKINFHPAQRLHRYRQQFNLSNKLASFEETTYVQDDKSIQQQQQQENQPRSKSIVQSFHFFINFVVYKFWKNRHERYQQRQKEGIEIYGANSTWKTRLAKLNQQRLELVTLANYSISIVAPSFLFLFLGALTTSLGKIFKSVCKAHLCGMKSYGNLHVCIT
jgi:hypothetical protein